MYQPLTSTFQIPISEANKQARQITYYQWGSEHPDVLFCSHGLTRNGRDFDYIAEAFMSKYHIIAVDVAGRGRSDWLQDKSQYHNFTYAMDIFLLLKSLNITKLDWIGTSMGGLIGMLLASGNPGLINKMVINDIGPFIKTSALKRIAEYTGTNPRFKDRDEAVKYVKMIYQPWDIKNEDHWIHLIKHTLKQDKDGSWIFIYDPGIGANFRDEAGKVKDMPDIDLWEIWGKITSKVLTLRGGESDILDADTAYKMTILGPQSKLIEFTGTGHAPSLMEDEHIMAIKGFLG